MAISFSVIVPVYNKGRYLKDCIDSILCQSYGDFELIAINDGSTDNSLEILESYNDARLIVVSTANGGVSKARNKGISLATKDYVTFIDGDDRIDSDYLKHYALQIESTGCDLVIGGLTKVKLGEAAYSVCWSLPSGIIAKNIFVDNFAVQFSDNEGIPGYVASKFVRRTLLNQFNLRFNTEIKLAEDLDFWAKVYLKVNSIAITRNVDYFYLQESENSTHNLAGQTVSQLKLWINILNNYAQSSVQNRDLILKKIIGITEVIFLELSELNIAVIRRNLKDIEEYILPISDELKRNSYTFLQSQILKSNSSVVLLYLKLRNFYHQLREWQS